MRKVAEHASHTYFPPLNHQTDLQLINSLKECITERGELMHVRNDLSKRVVCIGIMLIIRPDECKE